MALSALRAGGGQAHLWSSKHPCPHHAPLLRSWRPCLHIRGDGVRTRSAEQSKTTQTVEELQAAIAVDRPGLVADAVAPQGGVSAAVPHTTPSSDPEGTNITPSKSSLTNVLSLALPLMLQNVVGYASSVINMAYVGKLGATELGAFVLGCSIYNVFGLSVALGLSTGMDTLAGSAFGAKEYGKLGLIAQRAVLVCWLTCVPVAIAWFNAESLLLALGQQPDVSRLAARLLVLWVPCLFLNVMGECIKRFLQAQRLVKPLAVAGLATVLLSPLWFHLCMSVWNLGLDGSALASTLIQITSLAGLLGFTIWHNHSLRGKPELPWRGWQLGAALAGWREYLSYGVPAAVMICLEWWVFEAVVIMSGWLPDPSALAAMGICVNVNGWAYMLPMGLAAAVNTSVANALGAGNGSQGARAFTTGMALVVALQVALAGTVFMFGKHLVPLLCQDPAVQAVAVGLLPALACIIILDGLNAVVAGTLRGAGRQTLGAVVNGMCAMLAIPAAWLFAFKMGMGGQGLWFGVVVGGAVQLVVLLSVLVRATLQHHDDGLQKDGDGVKKVQNVKDEGERRWWQWDWYDEARRLQGVAAAAH